MGLKYPSKVVVGDISVRDGLQHEERFIPTRAKLWLAEQLILAGFKRIEVTNFGNPRGMPQFADADELMESIYTSKLVADHIEDVETTAITIRERAVERAIASRQKGFGPDRILFMVSTSESHHRVNSGLSLKDYWKMAEKYIQLAQDNGLKVCGTVSTIWGCPIEGPTDTKKALEFTRRWLDIGADDIEHADHDGSAPPNEVYDYYRMVLDAFPDPN
ncbi:MAG: pyruvate carboxyltransferase, partial [Deltaproteobacteria bacterium]|nr:pyruvate carboxyltransferase [Deltaproteobacteria bacterium]